MKNKLDSLNLQEIIGHSIESEEQSRQFYKKFVENGKGQLVPERFKSLMRDEETHKETLLELHEEIYGNKDYVTPEGDDLPPHEDFDDLKSVVNLIDALEKAIKNERNAINIYEYLAEEYEEYSSYFSYLASMEHGHLESLNKEREVYEKHPKSSQEDYPSQSFWENLSPGSWMR